MSVTVPEYTGCAWPVDPACLGADWDSYETPIKDRAVALTSETLHRLTGNRVGGCPVTLRPLAQGAPCPPGYYSGGVFTPYINTFGDWVNGCGSAQHCEIALPRPVGRVDEVKVDGTALNASDYRVDSGNLLTWQGAGACPWSKALLQDPTVPDSEPGTISVTYLNAYEVDGNGAYAAGLLAVEFAKACMGAKDCRLPRGVQTISRDGTSVQLISGAFPDGKTGIREVDSYTALWNPRGQQPSAVWPSPQNYRVQG